MKKKKKSLVGWVEKDEDWYDNFSWVESYYFTKACPPEIDKRNSAPNKKGMVKVRITIEEL